MYLLYLFVFYTDIQSKGNWDLQKAKDRGVICRITMSNEWNDIKLISGDANVILWKIYLLIKLLKKQ